MTTTPHAGQPARPHTDPPARGDGPDPSPAAAPTGELPVTALYGTAYKTDPYPLYDRMRARCPVHRVEFPSGVLAWLVTGYDAAHAALNDRRLGKDHRLGNDRWRARAAIMPEPQHSQLQVHLLHQDPPKHTAMRALVLDALTPRRVATLRPRIQRLADDLVDALPASGPTDLVAGFAAHLPLRVLAEVIGLSPELTGRFRREWGRVVAPVGPTDPGRADYERLLRELQDFIAAVVADKLAGLGTAVGTGPAEDLLGRVVAAARDGVLSDAERDSMIFQLLVAGQEPVTNQITTALVALLAHPDAMAELVADPALIDTAIEELLRYDGAFELTTWRFFAEDTTLHGAEIPAGDSVIVSLAAADRDPHRFAEPDRLDLRRSPNPHLAFGHGIHFCPGAALARAQLQIAVGTLITRLPGLAHAASPTELAWTPSVLGRGVGALPVVYDRVRPT